MASVLRPAFRVASLTHCRDTLKILWADGIKSQFSNNWLRSAVRDSNYFNAEALVYSQLKYIDFIGKGKPLISAEHIEGEEDITVNWEDHTTRFDASWLRAQDHSNNQGLFQEPEFVQWDATSELPVHYQYSERREKLESWLTDLRKYGVVYFEGAPATKEGMENVFHEIGIMKQRHHPINAISISHSPTLSSDVDPELSIYGTGYFPFHIDGAYYKVPIRLSCIAATQYSAPVEDTYNYFVDSLKVTQELRREDPQAYKLLTTIPIRYARRRLSVYPTEKELCDPSEERMYDYEAVLEQPLIGFDEGEGHPNFLLSYKHAGFKHESVTDHSVMAEHYRAYKLLLDKIYNPAYQQKYLIKEGCMAIFNNHRIVHSRGPVHPTTSRHLYVGFMSEEMWRTRWRVILGEKTGLEDKWLYGLSQKELQILANRKESAEQMQEMSSAAL